MGRVFAVVLCLLLVAVAATAGAPRTRVAVFVTVEPSPEGFVEPALLDSVRDLQREIPKRRNLQLARRKEEAVIVLTVVARRIDQGPTGAYAAPIGKSTMVVPIPFDQPVLVTFMTMDDFTRPVIGFQSGGAPWGHLARKVTQDIDAWVVVNVLNQVR